MEAEYQSQLSERLHKIEKVTNELDLSNIKVKHQMEQLDQSTSGQECILTLMLM